MLKENLKNFLLSKKFVILYKINIKYKFIMKRLTKVQKAQILKWEDIPLDKKQLKRMSVPDNTKYISISGGSSVDLSKEQKEQLRIILKSDETICIEIETDYEGYVDEIEIMAGACFYIDENDDVYNERMRAIKEYEFENLLRLRKIEEEKDNKKKRIVKNKDEYAEFLRLKTKFE